MPSSRCWNSSVRDGHESTRFARPTRLLSLEGLCNPVQRRELGQSAPLTLQVPSGRQLRLVYEPDRPPVLAVRLQEIFGWTETPRLGRGRVPVLLHLLGPNSRPVQITADLQSFWTTTYHQVRKDLRRRYPKHSWPEDPLTAEPSGGPGKKPGCAAPRLANQN